MAAVRAVVRLIEAGVHQEGHAAAQRTHKAEQTAAPKVGRVSAFVINNGWDMELASWALDLNWKIEVLGPKSRRFLHLRIGSSWVRLILLNNDGRFWDVLLRLGSILMNGRVLDVWILVGRMRDGLTDWDGWLVIGHFCLWFVSEFLVISFLHLKFGVRK